ncbi:3-hydroxyacyl-CoA dehydrogenase [Algiphilus sp. NNCM1]|uniref:3-hydroxyacyl-CoA dehydrogenase n=1 Tax=Algiphilus sp. TaxID=1872431 RepID=UPI001CA6120B|nr:3-hydroxyacyl-CoA dehydrogenase [Algiphilus sp.]MBY8964891.1 3-hydroxyacyl-CoA dehydrogenase [Algiphilus acroporae]MCI5062672.1 3-hydroxyacyl-CoA dehydrogenase [Algiphilus sp.]MCI5103285.1 3-hydroxyacyl-CoA dehydrogenase [Algiphilus sp.]
MQIANHSFLVTGGASGLGAASVRRLASAGGNVIIADLNEEAGEALANELGERARFVRCNVTDPGEVQSAIDLAGKAFGGLHSVVQCAGIGYAEKAVHKEGPHDLDRFTKVIQVNLIGTFNVLRLAAAVMSEQTPNEGGERGVIVNTASVAAFDGQIGQCAYSASKAGVAGMTLPAARDLSRSGIRVVTIAPGLFETPMLLALPEEAQQSLGASVPFPSRLGKPAEYADLAAHIVENAMLNGETIRLDGALRMAPK